MSFPSTARNVALKIRRYELAPHLRSGPPAVRRNDTFQFLRKRSGRGRAHLGPRSAARPHPPPRHFREHPARAQPLALLSWNALKHAPPLYHSPLYPSSLPPLASFPTSIFYLIDSSGHSRFVLRILVSLSHHQPRRGGPLRPSRSGVAHTSRLFAMYAGRDNRPRLTHTWQTPPRVRHPNPRWARNL